ncbi:MAG TPA: PIG-L family deacetylase [Blastocatellia bacterium]|nr:PIG-L family deacetylase [Blastocatellia bacterium]
MKLTLSFGIALTLLAGGAPPRHSSFLLRVLGQFSQVTVEDERGIVALDQSLREITNPFTVLCIAARPGDEDDGTLAYARKKLGARAVILFATRGEGEDSPTRPELDQELGAVRTREAIEAARVIGADVLFLNLRDIGYSKSADEALSAWGHAEALRRMVRAIRSLRPDVIITNHASKTGEGVERAVARLALEAFNAAGATKLAPQAGSEVWQARRFLERTDDATAGVKIDLNEYDHVRGITYAQIGFAAHHVFLSRGSSFDRLTPKRETIYYKLIASAPDDTMKTNAGSSTGLLGGLTLPENLSRSIAQPRVGDLKIVDAIASGERLIDALIEKLVEKRAEGTTGVMHERYGSEFVRVVRFTAALERAIALALGLTLEVTVSDRVVVPGQTLSARIVLRNGGVRAFPAVFTTPERLPAPDKDSAYKDSDVIGVGTGGIAIRELEYEIEKDAVPTLPHSAHLYDEDYYSVGSTLPGAQPAAPFGGRLVVSAEIGLGQVNIRLGALARFDVASPVEISPIPFALVRNWSKPRDITVPLLVRNRTPGKLAGALWVVPLALTDDDYDPVHITFAREDEEVTIKLRLRLPILKPPLAPDVLIEFRREKPAPADVLGSAKIAVKAADFDVVEGLKAGYIRGLDAWLSFALTELGVEHSEVKIDDISVTEHGNAISAAQSRIGCGDLARFDTIIVDSNAYFGHPELMRHNRCLLRYVRQGGKLLVLSQLPDDWNLVLANTQFAPFPITLSKDRITIETAAVKILNRDHPLMSKPNKIAARDFEGWVVERAVNIPREWSSEYTPLLESSDPGEEPNRGSLLVARYGEGTYIYVSLSLRRQLLAGSAGAYRLFADLLSLPKVNKSPAKPQ